MLKVNWIKFKASCFEAVKSIGMFCVVCVLGIGLGWRLSDFLGQNFGKAYVPSGSMIPTLQVDDCFIFSYWDTTLSRGDVALFESHELDAILVKRVIGVGGDTVRFTDAGEIFVNEARLDEPYLDHTPSYNNQTFVVPDNHYFFLGDNRDNSHDSRNFQHPFIPQDDIVGTANFTYWPISSWKLLN